MPNQHTCLTCLRVFTKRGTRQYRYCSVGCAHVAKRAPSRQCETCGADFWPQRRLRYCSRVCWRKRPQPLEDRFWAKVNKDGPTIRPELGPCWIWTGARSSGGYGSIGTANGARPAHRVSWLMHVGQIPEGLDVCHHCDNPPCVRPDHLFVGTTQENIDDMDQKGRRARLIGEANPHSRLTEAAVIAIRAAAPHGRVARQALADKHGICYGYLGRVLSRKAWPHV